MPFSLSFIHATLLTQLITASVILYSEFHKAVMDISVKWERTLFSSAVISDAWGSGCDVLGTRRSIPECEVLQIAIRQTTDSFPT